MKLPNYKTRIKSLENLHDTIDAIFKYNRAVFKTKSVAKSYEMKDGHLFGAHIKHLVEAEYLSKWKTGANRENLCTYSVNDWNDLGRYYKFIQMLLRPSHRNIRKLEKIKQT